MVLDSDAEDADDGRSSAVQTAEFLSRFQPPWVSLFAHSFKARIVNSFHQLDFSSVNR